MWDETRTIHNRLGQRRSISLPVRVSKHHAAALPEAQVYVKYIMYFAVVPKVGIQGLY
jgi:hypothetical protein